MLKQFRSHQLAVKFYRICEKIRGAPYLQDQLMRGASSIAPNLAEGSERVSDPDRRRFYRMAMGSIRECQATLDLIAPEQTSDARALADELGASVFKLCKSIDIRLNSPDNSERRAENLKFEFTSDQSQQK